MFYGVIAVVFFAVAFAFSFVAEAFGTLGVVSLAVVVVGGLVAAASGTSKSGAHFDGQYPHFCSNGGCPR